eukprot:TRINITY_DN3707_c0_g1_i3.p1 TRINITY_DN3707_c0_g1~~TRINITY_DN3707_c0_g1_i3.p1  ORF type:complete len:560 (+),score=94.19 TRINITY_DN3707_c0_g1_i3:78-1682(+)
MAFTLLLVTVALAALVFQLSTASFQGVEERRFLAAVQQGPLQISSAAALAAAIKYSNKKAETVAVVLTNDIVISTPLPAFGFLGGISITSQCKTKTGAPRQCIIDGLGKNTIFSGSFACTIILHNVIVQNALNSVHNGNCGFTAVNCTFRNNLSKSCGAVLNIGTQSPVADAVQITSSLLINNVASQGGGAICIGYLPVGGPALRISYSTFSGNKALSGGGGAILALGAPLGIYNSVFQSNVALKGDGGAIQVSPANEPVVINSTFSNNSANVGNGGALAVTAEDYVLLCRNTFTGNSAPRSTRSADLFLSYLYYGQGTLSTCAQAPARVYAPVSPGAGQPPSTVKPWNTVSNCTGCTGCDGDCYGNGKCGKDSYSNPLCYCNNAYDSSSSCTTCLEGFTPASKCSTCFGGFLAANISTVGGRAHPKVCQPCKGIYEVPNIPGTNTIFSTPQVSSSTACQKACNSTASLDPYKLSYLPCQFWVYFDKKAPQPGCRGSCVLFNDPNVCFPSPVMKNTTYGMVYQSLANQPQNCHR